MAPTETRVDGPPRGTGFIEIAFVVSLLGKAALALLQLGSGLALLVLPKNSALQLIDFLARNELAEDPGDPFAGMVAKWVATVDPQATQFYVVYLLGHGALHAVVVLSLLMRWRIAYPFSLASLMLFVIYQTWHYTQQPDKMLLVLTAVDIFVIVIVILEHRQSSRRATPGADT